MAGWRGNKPWSALLDKLFDSDKVEIVNWKTPMKYKIIICLSLLIIGSGLSSVFAKNAPTSAEQLRSEVESALKAKDANALMGLFNWQGVSDNFKTMMAKMVADMPNHEWTAVKLAPLPADFQATNELNGIRYRPNVEVAGWIVVEFTPKGNATQLIYGKSGDAYYLSCNVEEKIPGPFTKAKALSIMVMGTEDMKSISGSCIFVQSGKEIKHTISERGTSFLGDYIKSCTVQKTADDGETMQLTIEEDGKQIFDSQEITNKEIVYEKK